MPGRARPLPLTAGFWLVPIGMGLVGLSALLLVAEIASLPILLRSTSTGAQGITGAVPFLVTGGIAVVGAGLFVRGRVSVRRHRRALERRALHLERMRTPEQAGVSPGVAGTAHRMR